MQTGMNIQELAAELARVDSEKRDFIVPTTQAKVIPSVTIDDIIKETEIQKARPIDGISMTFQTNGHDEAFKINKVAHSQISQKLGIPLKYYNKMLHEEPILLTQNINTWMQREGSNRLIRTLDGNVRAFLSDRYGIIYDNALALSAAFPVLASMEGLEFKGLYLTDKKLYIQCVWPNLQADVKVGEPVQAGIVISNSDVGLGLFSIERLIYELTCGNGQVFARQLGKTHLSSKIDNLEDFYSQETVQKQAEAFSSAVRDHVSHAFDEITFNEDVQVLRKAAERKIPAPAVTDTVEEISSRYNLVNSEQASVLGKLIEGGDLSQWGMSRAVTNHANDVTDHDRVVELERIGGSISQMSGKVWEQVTAIK